jgi:ribonucleoside-diphosphate reductase alpha chain
MRDKMKSEPPATEFFAPISREIWERKYRLVREGVPIDMSMSDSLGRVADAAASVEEGGAAAKAWWGHEFRKIMGGFGFIPGGRILAGAGTGRDVTLFNCFVLGRIDDDLSAIFDSVREAALTMQAGGGIGHDFSTLRPRHAPVRSVGADASGPTSFMDVWDAMCRTIMSAGQRRGAMMATLRCDHPDIEEFIEAKADVARLRNFNLSVLVTDPFIAAVKSGGPWPLVFEGKVYRTVDARALWSQITRSNYAFAEPGVIFIDRVNAMNNLAYCETIASTNPCGEQPLPPYGACLLGSLNLAAFVIDPFEPHARIDQPRLIQAVVNAVRLLDNIIDVSRYPLPAQEREAKAKRRIGLGITGLADALIMLGLPYGSNDGREFAAGTMAAIQAHAYLVSAGLAEEKGPFPLFDREAMLACPNIARLPAEVRGAIAASGLRNGCLTSIAPTGTISLLAGNVSSGIEPVFEMSYRRNLRAADGSTRSETVEDYAHALYRQKHGGASPPPGPAWVTAHELTPEQHLAMQAALQPHVDSAISKTINCPVDIDPVEFGSLYMRAYDLGLKGCTTFRPNSVTGAVLVAGDGPAGTSEPTGISTSSQALGSAASKGIELDNLRSDDCPICKSPRTKPDGSCRVCLNCGRSLCA